MYMYMQYTIHYTHITHITHNTLYTQYTIHTIHTRPSFRNSHKGGQNHPKKIKKGSKSIVFCTANLKGQD